MVLTTIKIGRICSSLSEITLRHKRPEVALNECVYVFLAGLPLKLLARDKLLFTSFLHYVWIKYCQATVSKLSLHQNPGTKTESVSFN